MCRAAMRNGMPPCVPSCGELFPGGRVGVSISVERLEEADGSLQLDEQKLASLAGTAEPCV